MNVMSEKKRRGPLPNPDSKRSKGVNRNRHPRKAFHAEASLMRLIEDAAAHARPQTTESAVIRDALIEYFEKRGQWPPAEQVI